MSHKNITRMISGAGVLIKFKVNPAHFFHPDQVFHFSFSQHKAISYRSVAAINYILFFPVFIIK